MSVKTFLTSELKSNNYDYFLFTIYLNLQNKSNKFDVSTISFFKKEDEVLLMPYFPFKVLRNYPFSIDDKNVCVIEVEEFTQNSTPRRILWFDPSIMSKENAKNCNKIQTYYGLSEFLCFAEMKDAIFFIKKHEEFNYFVISCGSKGKEFFDVIADQVHVMYLSVFCYDKEKHSKWFNNKNYGKYAGIFDNFREFESALPYYACS